MRQLSLRQVSQRGVGFVSDPGRVLFLDYLERKPWYDGVLTHLDCDWRLADDDSLADPLNYDLVVVNDERALSRVSAAVVELARLGLPTLHILDGILEWRNTWENPVFDLEDAPALPLFRPILCHKAACLGRSQIRILESWGNRGKCELVGLPRLDSIASSRTLSGRATDELRVLVATARTPGFTKGQLERVEQSLVHLRDWFDANPRLDGKTVRPVWRISEALARRIAVPPARHDRFGADLAEALDRVDAVVSGPSTLILEGMLKRVPVVMADYNNCPQYVSAAWTITARSHVDPVMREVLRPPDNKLEFQEHLLHDSLECRTPAGPRLQKLITEMIRIGRDHRRTNSPLEFPDRILDEEGTGPAGSFEMHRLYPEHEVFTDADLLRAQTELGHLRRVQVGLARRQILNGRVRRMFRRILRRP